MERNKTRKLNIGKKTVGGSPFISLQSMCDSKTSNVDYIIKEINDCAKLGADMMRVSILDDDDIEAIKIIQKNINIPLICDIQYDLNYAIKAINNGCDAIRINPGNTKKTKILDKLLSLANSKNIPIRIGINEGALKIHYDDPEKEASLIVKKTMEYVKYFEKQSFFNIVISVKSSDPMTTLYAYQKISKRTDYPLHIGVTESGFDEIGIIRSTAILAPLILQGIGDTIRISLTKDPRKEIITEKRLLHDLGLYKDYPTIISCPTCGRCKVSNIKELADKTLKYLEENNINIKVTVMGCVVNGIEEGKNSDIGLAGANKTFIIFKDKKILKTVTEKEALTELFREIDKFKTV